MVAIAAAALLLAVVVIWIWRAPDPIVTFSLFADRVQAHLEPAIREGFAQQDRDHWYLKDGLNGPREIEIALVKFGDIRRTDSLLYPVESELEVSFSSSVPINGLRRIHVNSFAEDTGIEIFTAVAKVKCGFDGERWRLVELRQTPIVSIAWQIGSKRERVAENLAEIGESKEWFSVLQSRLAESVGKP